MTDVTARATAAPEMPDAPSAATAPPAAKESLIWAQPTGLPRRLRNVLSLLDFEEAARKFLPRPIFGFISGAAEENAALDDNRAAFAEYGFVPRVLNNVSQRSQATTLFGQKFAAPFGLAPMGMSALAAYRGDLVLAQAARAASVPMIMSGSSLIRLEDVVAANPDAWFQAYLPGETAAHRGTGRARRARRASRRCCSPSTSTVLANRENNIRAGFTTPLKPTLRLAWDGITRPGLALRHRCENADASRHAALRELLRDARRADHRRVPWCAISARAIISTGSTSR